MSSHAKALSVVLLMSVATAGCAAAPAAGTASGTAPGTAPVRRMTVLSAEDLRDPAVRDGMLLDAIQRLRPNFLVTRSSPDKVGASPVEVSVNSGPLGPLSTIAELRANAVQSVTHFTSTEAGQRFGMRDRFGPVLLVVLK